jgi:mycothiol synthase
MTVAEYGVAEKLAEKPAQKPDRNYENGHSTADRNGWPLPAGYTARPVTMADLEAAVALFNTCSMAVHGVNDYKVEDLAREWKHPGFDMATDTQAVFAAEGQMVGYYDVFDRGAHVSLYPWGRIHPAHQGSGVGDTLMTWVEQRSRQVMQQAPPEARVVMIAHVIAPDTATRSLVERAGFRLIRHSLRMVIELTEKPAEPQWPDGITVRTANMPQDLPAVAMTVREAFHDHWGHVEVPFEQELERWQHWTSEDKEFDPTLWWLAWDGEELAGVSLGRAKMNDDPAMGWVNTLGVRRPWRRLGLGLALLQESFGEFYRRGQQRVGLGVDAQNLTGALRLYERAGMRSDPKWQHDVYEKELRPGVDLTTTEVTT